MAEPSNHPSGGQPGEVGANIYEVVSLPAEKVRWLREENIISIGDLGWDAIMRPENGLIHLTGYDTNFLNIWYADFSAAQVRYVCSKPLGTGLSKPNPFPVLKDRRDR